MDETRIRQLLDLLSFDQCKDLLVEFVREEPDAGNTLKVFIEKKLRKDEIENPEQLVDRSFCQMTQTGDYWHRHLARDWHSIDMESYNLFERAQKATAAGHPDAALIIGTRWLEDFAHYFDEDEVFSYDDEGVSLSIDCENAEQIIKEAIKHPKVSSEVKFDIAKRLTKLADTEHNPFMDYCYLDIKKLSTDINDLYLSDPDKICVLERLLEETESQTTTHDSSSRRWLERLTKIHESLGHQEKTIDTYRRLYIYSEGDLEYYKILKQLISPEEWTQFRDNMVMQTKYPKYFTNGKNNLAELLVLEGILPALHDWLKDKCKDTNSFTYYLPMVPQELRTDLFPVYRNKILSLAEQAGKREEYERIAKLLAKLKKLPEGQEIAVEIAKTLKDKYSRKSMFMGELKRALGLNQL